MDGTKAVIVTDLNGSRVFELEA